MKTKHLTIALMLGAAALSACAKRVPPQTGATIPDAGPGGDYDGGEQDDPGLRALQSALVAAAGSDRVFFGFDAYTLSPEARATLTRQAAWLRQNPRIGFSIEGHADERGTREYNLALGDRRARAAAEFLILQGIDPTRISTLSYGKERPDALGSDEQSHARNRRAVSIVIRN
ncbi:peptidoglycan-associated lipoprotein Pal [Sphingomonas sp. HF-S3]|uniref:Peptidoglycan-associated lipoprotein n=1 Tax=Sphingomonas rustica TaxID=3103142 RepID=A0ABV0BBB7_9SPHN